MAKLHIVDVEPALPRNFSESLLAKRPQLLPKRLLKLPSSRLRLYLMVPNKARCLANAKWPLRHSPLPPRYIFFLASPNHIPSRHPKILVLTCYLFQIDSEQQKQTRKYGQMEKRNANDGEKSFTSREVVILRPSSSFPRLHSHIIRKRREWRLPQDSPHQPSSSGIQASSLQILWIV